jgi:hypothetical protein
MIKPSNLGSAGEPNVHVWWLSHHAVCDCMFDSQTLMFADFYPLFAG